MVLVRHRPDHPLHRQATVLEVAIGCDLEAFEVLEKRLTCVPGHRVGPFDHVVAPERGDGNRCLVAYAEL